MSLHPITLNLPENDYKRIRRAAETIRRPVDEVLVEALLAVAPALDTSSESLQSSLAQMAYLNDAALWQAARATMTVEQRTRLEDLHHKQQRKELTKVEEDEEKALLTLYRETILVRAQAAVLLKQRGYDVSDLAQFQPLN